MTLRLPDRWLWDFWFARDGDEVHVFYLQAPRALGDPELRHRNATIGHAVSRDLRDWRVLPDALGPGEPGAFDDLATWTGSIVEHGGRWMLLYTGVSGPRAPMRSGSGWRARRTCCAGSATAWCSRPTRAGTSRRPGGIRGSRPAGTASRCSDRAGAQRAGGRPRGDRARAVADLRTWDVLPPVSEPGAFLHLEVPQRIHLGGPARAVCVTAEDHAAARLAQPGARPQWGTHYLTAAERDGPYRLDREEFLAGDPEDPLYAGRVVEHRGGWWFMGWHVRDRAGAFRGELGDPIAIEPAADGGLRLNRANRSVTIWRRGTPACARLARVARVIAGEPQR